MERPCRECEAIGFSEVMLRTARLNTRYRRMDWFVCPRGHEGTLIAEMGATNLVWCNWSMPSPEMSKEEALEALRT